ncbi:hypothetical protein [Crossiella sp. CA198]|uniref:hypothetical protein n=1 Tax=Crossiella sp. CA198 TaxID=3455607 RepID=UPI003F8CF440
MESTRTRRAAPLLPLALFFAAINAGVIFLVHAEYASWRGLTAVALDPVHRAWSGTVFTLVIPLAVVSTVLALVMIFLRHPLLPRWTVWTGVATQAVIMATSILMWPRWQQEIGQTKALGAAYESIMDTHWLRVALMTAYSVFVLAQTLYLLHQRRSPVPA